MEKTIAPTIRPAIAADLPALNALVERAYRGDAARVGWTHEADLLGGQRTDVGALADTLADGAHLLLVAEDDGALIGTVTVVIDDVAHLGMLAVDPVRQASGVGRRLVAAAEQVARDAGVAAVEMTVIGLRPELIAWYQRLGYARTGEIRPFPATDPRFGLPKRDDLDFVVLTRGMEG